MSHTTVLVVDGDVGTRRALQECLVEAGFMVELADSGACALRQARPRMPDVVLTDLTAPELDGIALCAALHELDADLPVIVASASRDIPVAVQALRAGVDDYLTKPVDPGTMLHSIQRALDRRALKVEREHLRARSEELYQQTLAAVQAHEEVLAIVAHDLRNPLSAISLRAQLLADLGAAGEAELSARETAASILRSVARMDRLIGDLLDDTRIRTGHLHLDCGAHRLSDLLADVAELRPLARQRRIAITISPPANDQLVGCDRARLNQVLGNLVTNAIKFSPDGATVTVYSEPADGGVNFVVVDQGPGIDPVMLPKIFDRFWQPANGPRTGVGLGLFIAKGIVEAHRGHLAVVSRPGEGSRFTVFIPDTLSHHASAPCCAPHQHASP